MFDILAELRHATLGNLKNEVALFLRGATENMRARGFMGAPIEYQHPVVYFDEDARGTLYSADFLLTFTTQMHSLAFYICWNDYHWESRQGTARVLQLRNPDWEGRRSLTNLARTMGTATTGTGRHFLEYTRMEHPNLAIGNVPEGQGTGPAFPQLGPHLGR